MGRWERLPPSRTPGLFSPAYPAVIDQRTLQEETALYLATCRGHLDCLQSLLQAGAEPDISNKSRETPLYKGEPPPHSGLPWGSVQRVGGQLGTLLPKCITPSLAPLLPSQGSPVKGGCLRATLPKSSCGPGTPRSAEGPETKSYDRCPSALPAQWAATHRQHKQPGNKDLSMMHPGASGRALALGVSTHKRGRRS